jgi:hypothetical protein
VSSHAILKYGISWLLAQVIKPNTKNNTPIIVIAKAVFPFLLFGVTDI